MESKRRAFPRFYFVSTADLLDILSNGNNPHKASASRLAAPKRCRDVRFRQMWPFFAVSTNAPSCPPAPQVMQHMSKCFQAIDRLKLDQAEAKPGGPRPKGLGMVSCVGEEYVPFASPLALEGKVRGALGGIGKDRAVPSIGQGASLTQAPTPTYLPRPIRPSLYKPNQTKTQTNT
jgi:dynein heavy chain